MRLAGALVFCLFGDDMTYLGDGDTDRREVLHDGTYRSGRCFSVLGTVPPTCPKSTILVLDKSEHLENGKSQRYMPIRT